MAFLFSFDYFFGFYYTMLHNKFHSVCLSLNHIKFNQFFHWQSQSTTSVDSVTGKRYLNHKELGSKILLFVRENKEDKTGAFPYTFLGPVEYQSHEGSRPINIIWKLQTPIPGRYLEITNKLLSP